MRERRPEPAMRSYLDHNATSPLRPAVRRAMLAASEIAGNASSIHAEGRAARKLLDDARDVIAQTLGVLPGMVVFTSGGTSKLERYKALGVPEVWFWEDGLLKLYHLREGGYQSIERSELPGLNHLNLDLLRRCILMAETDAGEAIRAFRHEI